MIELLRQKMSATIFIFLLMIGCPVIGAQGAHGVDLVIFSYDRPLQLYALLESTAHFVTGLGSVYVIYRTSAHEYEAAYAQVNQAFVGLRMIKQGDNPHGDFKYLTLAAVYGSLSNYVVFAVDDIVVTGPMDFTACAVALETNNSYGFYARLGKNTTWCYPWNSFAGVPPLREIGNAMLAWNFQQGNGDWGYPNTVDMTMYRKKDVEQAIKTIDFHSPYTLEATWAGMLGAVVGRTGLCYEHSKMVNIPLNRVGEFPNRNMAFLSPAELLEIFNQGLKIDIKALSGIDNISAHMDCTPTFIER